MGSNPSWGESRWPRRRPGMFAGLVAGLLVAACLLPSVSSAIELRPRTEAFGADGTSGSSFGFPSALAFDSGNQRLYAFDAGAQEIYGFDSSTPGVHTPLGGGFPRSAEGFGFTQMAADPASHNLYFMGEGASELLGFDENGAALAGFPIAGQSYGCGVAVDSAGNVWATQLAEGKIREYSSSGSLIETYSVGGEPCNIAFDSADNLYVQILFGGVEKLTAASGYTSRSVIDPEFTSAFTVDRSTDGVYVVHYNYIDVRDSSGAFLYKLEGEPFGGEFSSIALDETTEELYVSDYGHGKVQVYGAPLSFPRPTTEGATGITATAATLHGKVNPKEQAVEDCHFEVIPESQFYATGYANVTAAEEFPCVPAAGSIPADANDHPVSANASGLASATVYHYRLVAANAIGESVGADQAFTTGPVAPLVAEQSVELVGTAQVTVTARINPEGGDTSYHVEYGTTNVYGQSTPESASFGSSSDNSNHTVSVHIGGLSPGAVYHFRFVAMNPAGSTSGTDTTFATYSLSPSFGPCPNENFRSGAGVRLPDCRAYEQASPIDKHGSDAQGVENKVHASPSGNRVTFIVHGGLQTSGGSSSLAPFMASRGPSGWSTDGILPPTESGYLARAKFASSDLSTVLSVVPGPGHEALYARDTATGALQLVFTAPKLEPLDIDGFTTDITHLLLQTGAQLLPSAVKFHPNLYDLDHGTLTLAGRVPAGSAISCDDDAGPACVVPPQGTGEGAPSTLSADGSRIFFTATAPGQPFGTGRIDVREDGARTTWISASQRTPPDPAGEKPARFLMVTRDESKVLFLSCEKLTDDSTAVSTGANSCREGFEPPQGNDLYSYDVDSGELTDLTVDSNASDPRRADVQGIIGASDDGSYVYFVANGALAPGALPGNCALNSLPNRACSLYLYHDGLTKFIARLDRDDQPDWSGGPGTPGAGARVASDGKAVVFSSTKSFTGYNNTPSDIATCPRGCDEFFRYSASDESLQCVSCNPTGARAQGYATLGDATVLAADSFGAGEQSRNLSSDGNRLFFESKDALVARDLDGLTDVYEWEAKGSGSCESESQNGGCLYLISTGTNLESAHFLDASTDGDHVFFFTKQQLVPTDKDQLYDVYDAGVGAGLTGQHELASATCASTACQANPAPPPDQTPGSAVVSGPGDVHRHLPRKCPKGKRKVRRAGKVSCRKVHSKHHKRHDNRGGAK